VATACERQVIGDIRLGAQQSGYLEEIDAPQDDADDQTTELPSGAVRYRLYFRIIDEEDVPKERPPLGADVAPLIYVLVDVDPTNGQILSYRYDLVDRAYNCHDGFHLHSHGGPPVAHRQGCTVKGHWEKHREVTFNDEVIFDLVELCFGHRML
jgi:hypothetical protein